MKSESEMAPSAEQFGTDGEMFEAELGRGMEHLSELIDASVVSPEKKDACRAIIEQLKDRASRERQNGDPYEIARGAVETLLDTLNTKDAEEDTLFEGLKEGILKARNTAKGWPWPSEQM